MIKRNQYNADCMKTKTLLLAIALLSFGALAHTAMAAAPNMPLVKVFSGANKFTLTNTQQWIYEGYAGDLRPPVDLLLMKKAGSKLQTIDRLRLNELDPYGNFSASLMQTGGQWYIRWTQRSCSDCSNSGLLFVSPAKLVRVKLQADNYTDPVPARFKGQIVDRFGGRYGFNVTYRLDGADVCFDRDADLKDWKAFFLADKVGSFTLDAAEAGRDPWQMFIGHYEMLMMYYGPDMARSILKDLAAGKIHLDKDQSGRNLADEAQRILDSGASDKMR